MQFLDKWQRSRLTSGDFICSILLDNIDYHQKQRGKVQHIYRDDFKAIQTRLMQGGRSCAGARVAPAEKFGLGRKF